MKYTKNLDLIKYDYTDKMDIEAINNNMDIIDNALGGLILQTLTPGEYAAISNPDPSTVYFVSDGVKLEIYLGTAKVSGGGSAPAVAAVSASVIMAAVGKADISHTSTDITQTAWEQGGIYVDSGGNSTSNTAIRQADYTPVETSSISYISVVATDADGQPLEWSYTVYNANKAFVKDVSSSGWKNSGNWVRVTVNTPAYIKIQLKRNSSLTPSALAECKLLIGE